MKTKNVIWIALLFTIIGSVICLNSCKKQQQTYTVKGYMYIGESKTPYGNQSFDIGVYDKDKGWLNTKDGYVWQSTIGTAKSNNDGYIEFTYSHQRKGKFLKFTQDLTGLYKDDEFLIPINKDITMEFYSPPCGYAAIFVNTNGKLTEQDTFFLRYSYICAQSTRTDTIYGNHLGYLHTLEVSRAGHEARKSEVKKGIRVQAGKGHRGFIGEPGYWRSDIDTVFQITGRPHIDSIYIEY